MESAAAPKKLNILHQPLVGVLLMVAGFALILWYEGRPDYAELASASIAVNADALAPGETAQRQGAFVAASGTLTTNDLIGDGQYLKPGPHVALERKTEMFSWMEREKRTGEGKNQTVTFEYIREWSDRPPDSQLFERPQGHANPAMPVADFKTHAPAAKAGGFFLDMASLMLPELKPLELKSESVMLMPGVSVAGGNILFVGRGTISNPEVGDLRIRYSVLEPGTAVTVFGMVQDSALMPYKDAQDHTFYRMLEGDREEALSALRRQRTTASWMMRGIGLLLLWGGLVPLFRKIFPAIGRGKVRMMSLFVSFLLAAIAIMVGVSIA